MPQPHTQRQSRPRNLDLKAKTCHHLERTNLLAWVFYIALFWKLLRALTQLQEKYRLPLGFTRNHSSLSFWLSPIYRIQLKSSCCLSKQWQVTDPEANLPSAIHNVNSSWNASIPSHHNHTTPLKCFSKPTVTVLFIISFSFPFGLLSNSIKTPSKQ